MSLAVEQSNQPHKEDQIQRLVLKFRDFRDTSMYHMVILIVINQPQKKEYNSKRLILISDHSIRV